MINWRKPVIFSLLYLTGSKIPRNLREIEKIHNCSNSEIKKYQENKLIELLQHAYNNVPYYRKILPEAGVIKDGEVVLKNFNKIPILTKEIIRKEGKNLYSKDYKKRKPYFNTSGGSTGEPVKFIQDKEYDEMNTATKIFWNKKLGKDLGDKEIKLWGSDRDILKGNLGYKERIINYLYNRKFFNCYNFGEQDMKKLIELNESFKPVSYWSYVEASNELAKYIDNKKIKLSHNPHLLISTIGPLYEDIRKRVEKSFGTKVYDQYGSREMGWISAEDKTQKLESVFWWRVLAEKRKITKESELLVTSLDNYSMPLIRYQIGDVVSSNDSSPLLNIEKVVGRTLGFFKRRDGSLYHTHHLVQQLFYIDWIKRFQIIQEDYGSIKLKIIKESEVINKDKTMIASNIKKLAGEVKIVWDFVDTIKKTKSGKHIYTISKLRR